MAAIGNSPTQQAFTPAIDYFSGNGSTTAFTLSRPVASVAQVQVTIDNVAQNPSSAYTVSANTITFTSAPLSGTNNIYVYYTSPITQVIAPGQGTVTATSFVSSTGTGAGVFQTSPTITTPVISSLSSASATALTLQSAGTTAVTVDTSQNVLIGTTTTTNNIRLNQKVAVVTTGSGAFGGVSNTSYNGTSAGTGPIFDLQRSRGTTDGSMTAVASGDTLGYVVFRGSDGSGFVDSSYITGQVDGAVGSGSVPGRLVFNTSGSERMRIGSNGQIYMATSSAVAPGGPSGQVNILNPNNDGNWALALQNNATTASLGRGIGIKNNTDFNTNSGEFIYCTGAGNGRFYVNSNGGVYNYSANNVNLSDRREKKNIEPAPSYLDRICQIPVKTFLFNDQTDTDLNLGVIAQDVQAVAPELITEANWGTREEPRMRLSIYEADLKYALMKSIQELKAINDTQAETLSQQTETINALTARIEALENR